MVTVAVVVGLGLPSRTARGEEAAPSLAEQARGKGTLVEFLEPAPLEKASAEDKALFDKIRKGMLDRKDKAVPQIAESGEGVFWILGAEMRRLMDAYEYSRDPALLGAFVPRMEAILKQRYVHPKEPTVWIGWFHYSQGANPRYYMPIHGAIMYYNPALRFIAAVRADDKLKEKYGATAEKWFKDITEVEIPAWDKRDEWRELDNGEGWYLKLWKYPDRVTGELKPLPDRDAGTGLEYNKVHAMIESFCMLYRMTGNEWYRVRIEKSERFLRNRWREDASHVEWNYRDFSGPWDYATPAAQAEGGPQAALGKGTTSEATPAKEAAAEDGEGDDEALPAGVNANQLHDGKLLKKPSFVHPKGRYYAADVRAIVDCYNLGLVFSKRDMENLVKTNLAVMWNQDEGDPKFKTIAGRGTGGSLWKALSQFDPRVLKIWKAELDAFGKRKKRPGNDSLEYLLAKGRAASWGPLHAKEPAPEKAPPAKVEAEPAPAKSPVIKDLKLTGEIWTCEADGQPVRGILIKPEGDGPFPTIARRADVHQLTRDWFTKYATSADAQVGAAKAEKAEP